MNEEVKRGSAVVGIFPNKETAIRIFGAVLGEQNGEWLVTTRHVSAESMQALFHPKDTLSSSASKCGRRGRSTLAAARTHVSIEALDTTLGSTTSILLDSTSLIAFRAAQDATHALARHVLSRIERADDPLRGFYSVVSVAELLVRPVRAGPREEMYMHAFLTGFPNLGFPNLQALNVDFHVAHQAANLRAVRNVKTPDALILARGLLAGCEAIVGNDEAWVTRLKPLFPELRWIYLPSYL